MRTHTLIFAGLGLIAVAMMFVVACSSDSDGDGRQSCTQPQDCGDGGRLNWICSIEGKCFSIKEYCERDDECNGACVDHLCEGGKIVDASDGDADAEQEFTGECQYDCCKDDDCRGSYVCDVNTHTCVPGGSEDDCASDEDCADGEQCSNGQCVTIPQTTCQPGAKSCCSMLEYDYPACTALGDLAMEAKITCAPDGRSWVVEMCPSFESCIYETQSTVTCFPNNRCESNDDCESGEVCTENDDNNLRCQEQ